MNKADLLHNGDALWNKFDPFTAYHDPFYGSNVKSWARTIIFPFCIRIWTRIIKMVQLAGVETHKWSKPWGLALPQMLSFLKPQFSTFTKVSAPPKARLFNFEIPVFSNIWHYHGNMPKCKVICCLTSLSTLDMFPKVMGRVEAECLLAQSKYLLTTSLILDIFLYPKKHTTE